MTDYRKSRLRERSKMIKKYNKYGLLQSNLYDLQEKTDRAQPKEMHVRSMTNNLNHPLAAPKTYWSILNRFLNNRKISAIPPPLLSYDIITNFFPKKLTYLTIFLQTNVQRLII